MLVLKLVCEDMTSYGGFKWPESGPVACDDWDPKPECGNGLHGWANGEGNYIHEYNEGKWLVVEVEDSAVVDLQGKVKFPRGNVVFCGNREGAVSRLNLTTKSNPGLVCLTPAQCATFARECAARHAAACAATYASDAARAATRAAAYAAYAADSARDASDASDAAAAAADAERERQRQHKLELLGIKED